MSDTLAEHVAAELRAQMARRQQSAVEIARSLGVSETWVSRRLNGHVPITIDDLDRIAGALGSRPAWTFLTPVAVPS